ncbi:MAG: hypothetical protein ACR2NA_08345 [Solirubrobacterales bacterium]
MAVSLGIIATAARGSDSRPWLAAATLGDLGDIAGTHFSAVPGTTTGTVAAWALPPALIQTALAVRATRS